MSAYAPVPVFAEGRRHPRALLLIVGAHAALLAAVMTAKPDLVPGFIPTITKIDLIPEPLPPPKEVPPPEKPRHESVIDRPTTALPLPQPSQRHLDQAPLTTLDPGPTIDPGPPIPFAEPAQPVRVGPRFATPESDVKPPYPQSKLRSGEETVLRLRLSIDSRGRVTAVEPVGTADPVFLGAARRHLIGHWHYRPATEDGRAVATSTVITLRFQLDK